MTAVLALRPDGAHGAPPALDGDAACRGTPGRPPADRGLPGRGDRRAAGRPPGRRGPARGRRSGRVRAHRRDHRRPEGRRAHPRQPARLRPGDRGVQRAGGRGGDAGRAAAVPRQRADRHRHRPDVQRRPGGVAGPGGLPRQGPVRPVLDRSSSTTGSRRCPPCPPSTRTLAQVPVDADISSLRLPIVGAAPLPASVREAFAAHTGRHLLEGYGLTEATCASTWTRPGEERPGSVGRALPGQQIKAVRIGGDGSWTDCAPGETGVLVIGGPAVFAGYVTDPGSRRPPGQPGRHRPGRLAGHRRPRPRRRRRVRLPHRPGQGPDHPRRPQHRPPGHRGRAAAPPRRPRRRGRRPPGPARRRGPGRLRRPGRPRPVRRGRPAGLGRHRHRRARRPAQAHLPGRPRSRSPRWASTSSPR